MKVVRKGIEIRDKAASDKKDYDVCVCLVDVDQHEALPAACQLAARESILLLVSNLKFEAWLRWHVEDKHSALSTAQLDARTAKLGLDLVRRDYYTLKRNSTTSPSTMV